VHKAPACAGSREGSDHLRKRAFSAHWKAWKKLLSIDQVFVILIMRVYYACRGILLWETYTCQRTEETVTWHEPQNRNPLWFPQGVLLMEKRISPDFFSTRIYRKNHKFCIEANWSSSQYVLCFQTAIGYCRYTRIDHSYSLYAKHTRDWGQQSECISFN